MKTWTAKVELDLGFDLTLEEIKSNKHIARFFKDANNPTDEEVHEYFEFKLGNLAGSNDGSEVLGNAHISVTSSEE